MNTSIRIFSIFTILGSLLGGLGIMGSFLMNSAPQQAAAAAVGIGFAVVPYCFTRAFEMYKNAGGQ